MESCELFNSNYFELSLMCSARLRDRHDVFPWVQAGRYLRRLRGVYCWCCCLMPFHNLFQACLYRLCYTHSGWFGSRRSYTASLRGMLLFNKAFKLLTLFKGLTIYKAIKNTKATTGQWVAISGAGGGLGHLGMPLILPHCV